MILNNKITQLTRAIAMLSIDQHATNGELFVSALFVQLGLMHLADDPAVRAKLAAIWTSTNSADQIARIAELTDAVVDDDEPPAPPSPRTH